MPETSPTNDEFVVKDRGTRESFDSGMVRSPSDGRTDFLLIRSGPMYVRWAEHLTKGAALYGRDNWMLAAGEEELRRFQESGSRHFEQWLAGMRDEDHASAVFFNVNGAEYVLEMMNGKG